jgi:hypothetical protein
MVDPGIERFLRRALVFTALLSFAFARAYACMPFVVVVVVTIVVIDVAFALAALVFLLLTLFAFASLAAVAHNECRTGCRATQWRTGRPVRWSNCFQAGRESRRVKGWSACWRWRKTA